MLVVICYLCVCVCVYDSMLVVICYLCVCVCAVLKREEAGAVVCKQFAESRGDFAQQSAAGEKTKGKRTHSVHQPVKIDILF